MPELANPKHETFARNLAAGMKTIDAYVAAGYTASPSSASQVAARPEVRQRILELKEELIEKERHEREHAEVEGEEDISLDWVERELKKNVKEARKVGNISASNKAIEMLIDIKGLSNKKSEPKKPAGEKDEPTDPSHGGEAFDDMLAKIEEIAARGDVFADAGDALSEIPDENED